MITVKIRTEDQTTEQAVHLCSWDAANLDALIPTLESWRVFINGVEYGGDEGSLVGQIAVTDTEAFFEVIAAEAAS